MPQKDWIAVVQGHSIRVSNTWTGGAKLYIDGERRDTNNAQVVSPSGAALSARLELGRADSPLVEVFVKSLFTVKAKICIDGKQVGGDVFHSEQASANAKRPYSAVGWVVLVIGVILVGVAALNYPKYRALSEMRERIAAENARVLSLPAMPIEVTYRKALLGDGLVTSFKNTSNRFLAVSAALSNPSLHQNKNFRIDLAPGQTREIGHMEGWAFSAGDTIFITHNEYRGIEVKIP